MYENLHNTELEKGVLSALMFDNYDDFNVMIDGLTTDCFTDKQLQRLFETMVTMNAQGMSIHNPILVAEMMNRTRGENPEMSIPEFLVMIESDDHRAQIAEHIPHYVAILADLSRRRKAFSILHDASGLITDLTVDSNETMSRLMSSMTDASGTASSTILSFADGMDIIEKTIDDNITGKGHPGTLTGIRQLDSCGGFHPSDLIIVAAGSSHGKTALATTIAMNMAVNSVGTDGALAIFSMEMSPRQLMSRMVAKATGISSNRILYARLTADEREKIAGKRDFLGTLHDKIFVDDRSTLTVDNISQSIRYLHARSGVKVAIIDYLQILGLKRMRGVSREEVVADAARRFKDLARELKISIVLLSQLNRDTTSGPVPTVARIRDSGEINEASDLTILLYRPDQTKGETYPGPYQDVDTTGTAMVIIGKDRHGGYGGLRTFFLGFNPELSNFYDLDRLPLKPSPAATNTASHPW